MTITDTMKDGATEAMARAMSEHAGPRLLSRSDLCAYLDNLSWIEVVDRIYAGRLPRPLDGASIVDVRARWDTADIDRALDRVAGNAAGREMTVDRRVHVRH